MISLKWPDVLSTLLPGAVGLVAFKPYLPDSAAWLLETSSQPVVWAGILLAAAAVAGGIFEALTRVTWEPLWLLRQKPHTDPLTMLKDNPDLFPLYEHAVHNSFKWVTFHANMAWALTLFLGSSLHRGTDQLSLGNICIFISVLVLLRASHVQWTYYVNYVNKVFSPSPLTGNTKTGAANAGE